MALHNLWTAPVPWQLGVRKLFSMWLWMNSHGNKELCSVEGVRNYPKWHHIINEQPIYLVSISLTTRGIFIRWWTGETRRSVNWSFLQRKSRLHHWKTNDRIFMEFLQCKMTTCYCTTEKQMKKCCGILPVQITIAPLKNKWQNVMAFYQCKSWLHHWKTNDRMLWHFHNANHDCTTEKQMTKCYDIFTVQIMIAPLKKKWQHVMTFLQHSSTCEIIKGIASFDCKEMLLLQFTGEINFSALSNLFPSKRKKNLYLCVGSK